MPTRVNSYKQKEKFKNWFDANMQAQLMLRILWEAKIPGLKRQTFFSLFLLNGAGQNDEGNRMVQEFTSKL